MNKSAPSRDPNDATTPGTNTRENKIQISGHSQLRKEIDGRPQPGPADETTRRLDRLAAQLVRDGLAPATRRGYTAGVRLYRRGRFCRHHCRSPLPASETAMLRFVAIRSGARTRWAPSLHAQLTCPTSANGTFFTAPPGQVAQTWCVWRWAVLHRTPGSPAAAPATPSHLRGLHRALRRSALPEVDRVAAYIWALFGVFQQGPGGKGVRRGRGQLRTPKLGSTRTRQVSLT